MCANGFATQACAQESHVCVRCVCAWHVQPCSMRAGSGVQWWEKGSSRHEGHNACKEAC